MRRVSVCPPVSLMYCIETEKDIRLLLFLGLVQWLKWSCEAGGGAHLTKPGWSKPHTYSTVN